MASLMLIAATRDALKQEPSGRRDTQSLHMSYSVQCLAEPRGMHMELQGVECDGGGRPPGTDRRAVRQLVTTDLNVCLAARQNGGRG